MHRRSFLGAFLAAPVALPLVAKGMAVESNRIAAHGVSLDVLRRSKPLSGWKEFKGPVDLTPIEFRVDYPALVMEEAYASMPPDGSLRVSPIETFGG